MHSAWLTTTNKFKFNHVATMLCKIFHLMMPDVIVDNHAMPSGARMGHFEFVGTRNAFM